MNSLTNYIFILLFSSFVFADVKTDNKLVNDLIIHANNQFVQQLPTLDSINEEVLERYTSFNVDALTPNQKKTLKYYQKNPLIIGLYEWDPYFKNREGKYEGLNFYLITLLKKVLKLDIKIEIGSFSKIKQKLKDGEVDIVPGLFLSEIKKNNSYSSNPYFLDMPKVYTTNMHITGISLEGLQNIRLGKRRENGYFNKIDLDYLAKNNIYLNIMNYETDEELIEAVKRRECDYIIGSESASYLAAGLYSASFTESDLGKLHYIGVSEKTKDILPIINQFLNQDLAKNLNYFSNLYKKVRLINGDFFTTEENNLLQSGYTLSVKAIDKSSYPDVYFDKSNKLVGREIYVFDRVSRLLGIPYVINLENSASKAISDLSNEKINTVLGVSDSLNRGGVITPTKSITVSDLYIIGYNDKINNYIDIFDANIGIIAGQIKKKYLTNMFPTKTFKVFDNQIEAEEGLIQGEIDYLIASERFYNYLIYYRKRNLVKGFKLDLSYKSVINFNSSINGILYASMFSKSFDFIDDMSNNPVKFDDERILTKLTKDLDKKINSIWGIIFIGFLFIGIFIITYSKLKNKKYNLLQKELNEILTLTNASYWSYKEDTFHKNVIVLTDYIVDSLELNRIRLIDRKNQTIIKFNNSLLDFFVNRADFYNLIRAGLKIQKGKMKYHEMHILIARDGNMKNVSSVYITIRAEYANNGKRKIFGIIQTVR